MAALRSSLICLGLFFAAIGFAAAQEVAEWERGTEKSVAYANLVTKKDDLFGFFCRKVNNIHVAGVVMRMPSFHTLIRDEQSYSLNIVIDGSRDSLTLKAKDIDLWFEAEDLNQQLALGRIFDRVKASHRLDLAISVIGWRGSYQFDGAEAALSGLMDHCL